MTEMERGQSGRRADGRIYVTTRTGLLKTLVFSTAALMEVQIYQLLKSQCGNISLSFHTESCVSLQMMGTQVETIRMEPVIKEERSDRDRKYSDT